MAYSYIRFSSDEQKTGDSLTRQTEAARRYCQQNGLTLDTTINLHDLGVSAFRGKNSDTGNLGLFLKAAIDGKIEHGATLLVENLDRLSREDVLTALDLLRKIVNQNITVVTLMDNRKYDAESIQDFSNLVVALSVMSRATEESKTKSIRGKSAWKRKLNEIADGKPTANLVPAWISYDKESNSMKPVHEKVQIIKRIFSLVEKGYGAQRLAKDLNFKGVPTLGRPGKELNPNAKWHRADLQKLLKNKQLIGEFITPDGKTIPDYFPAILTKEDFYKIQKPNNATPVKGPATTKNLFTSLLVCGYCGKSMNYTQKSPTRRYLTCSQSFHSRLCVNTTFPYDLLESAVLDRGLYDVSKIISDSDGDLKALRASVTAIEAQIDDKRKKIDSLIQTFSEATKPEIKASIERFINKADNEIMLLQKEKEAKSAELIFKESEVNSKSVNDIQKIVENKQLNDPEYRLKLRSLIREIIDHIELFSKGPRKTCRKDRSIAIYYRYRGSKEILSIRLNDPIVDIGFSH
jgi:DNA invertase Pin-like site-specific DNA recombinase